ncbi:hypothetical protein [Streptomyces sp. NPDC088794]|uniref:hypothetical protein n=1 Tax=Streptomyces sp. NPDC088794 TaxID=3365902 RepID=UPI0037F49D73
MISQLGFDTVDAGPLAESWRFEPETTAYVTPYFADPVALQESLGKLAEEIRSGIPPRSFAPVDAGRTLSAEQLNRLLSQSSRKLNADRVLG